MAGVVRRGTAGDGVLRRYVEVVRAACGSRALAPHNRVDPYR